jgi:glycosyltransferase involved in cell wall biosynthesis
MHSVHLVGRHLKRQTGVPWIAHFSDPWLANPFVARSRLDAARTRRLERAVLREADRVIFTSKQTEELVMSSYPSAWRAKVRVIPHAFDPELYPSSRSVPRGNRLVFRYVGAFYEPRSPRPLLDALRRLDELDRPLLDRIRVEIVGPVEHGMLDEQAVSGLPPGTVSAVPSVGYVRSLELMQGADGLLVVDAPAESSPFLPSKLVDYIGAGTAIAALTPPGAAADLTRRVGGPVADPTDVDACARALIRLAELAEEPRPFGEATVRSEYTTASVGSRMADVIAEVSQARPRTRSA